MIWSAIRTAIYVGLGVVEVVSDVYAASKALARRLRRSGPEEPKGPVRSPCTTILQPPMKREDHQ